MSMLGYTVSTLSITLYSFSRFIVELCLSLLYSTQKIRKMCLRVYDKTSEKFKDNLISQYYHVSGFLLIDALFGFVVPIAASTINVKVDWSSRYFLLNFNIRIKHGFRAKTVAMPLSRY